MEEGNQLGGFSQRFSIHFPREIHENPGGFGDLKVVLFEMERIITSNFKPTLFSSELLVVGNVSVTTILNVVEKNPSPCMGIPFASKILPDPTVTFSTFVDF